MNSFSNSRAAWIRSPDGRLAMGPIGKPQASWTEEREAEAAELGFIRASLMA